MKLFKVLMSSDNWGKFWIQQVYPRMDFFHSYCLICCLSKYEFSLQVRKILISRKYCLFYCLARGHVQQPLKLNLPCRSFRVCVISYLRTDTYRKRVHSFFCLQYQITYDCQQRSSFDFQKIIWWHSARKSSLIFLPRCYFWQILIHDIAKICWRKTLELIAWYL